MADLALSDGYHSPVLYLSGPMSGIPEYNFPAFNAAAYNWRQRGYTVLNPAEGFDGDTSLPRSTYIRRDIEHLLRAEMVACLPGWERSKGARLEVAIARELELEIVDAGSGAPLYDPDCACGEPQSHHTNDYGPCDSCFCNHFELPAPSSPFKGLVGFVPSQCQPPAESVLDEARRLVTGDRQGAYGHPLDDFSRSGHIMGAVLERGRRSDEYAVPPELVALCMIAVKLSREVNAHKRDNIVDGIGYWTTADMVYEERERRLKKPPAPEA